jgi:hypothetical protein
MRLLETKFIFGVIALFVSCVSLLDCGGGGGVATNQGSGLPPQTNPSFMLSISPSTINIAQGGSQPVNINVIPRDGFTDSVTVIPGALPPGITVSPSSVTIAAGSSQAINLTASETALIAQQTIAFNGTSKTSSGGSSLQLTIRGAPVPDPFHYVGGDLVHGFYDENRKLLFATNLILNELDVVSSTDYSLKARIPVPSPIGIDQMADGNTLVVGTSAQELVTVDENSYAVTTHPFSAKGNSFFSLFFPTVVAMANGKVFAIGQEEGIESNDIVNGGQTLFEWDSNTNTFTQIEPSSTNPPWETDKLARSEDHKWAVFSADQFYLYSSDTDTFTTAPLSTVNPPDDSFGVRGYAMNSDGSKIAVASAARVNFFDRSFNLLGTAQIPSAFQNARSAVRFSADGTKLYLEYALPLSLEEVDVGSFNALGYMSATVNPDDDNLEGLLAITAEGQAYFNIDGGVRVVNLSQTPVANPPLAPFPAPSCILGYTSLPLNTTQQLQQTNALTNASVYIGSLPATIGNAGSEITIPASSTPGPVDVECIDMQGNTVVNYQGVSYGVDPVGLSASLLPPAGNGVAYLFGFGFPTGLNSQPPSVAIGNEPSPEVALIPDVAGTLQIAAFITPSGTPAQSADVTASSSLGNGTLPAAVTYYPMPTFLPSAGILQLTFDTLRNRLYALKSTEVDVLDGASLKWEAPLAFPPGVSGIVRSMETTPDGSKLAVLVTAGNTPEMIVLDPTGSSVGTVTTYSGTANVTGSIAITNRNTVIVAGVPGLVFDLSTQTFSPLSTQIGEVGQVVRASADGSHVYSAALNVTSGEVYSIDPTTLTVSSEQFGQLFWTDLAVSSDGSQFAAVDAPPDLVGDAVGFFNSNLQYINANAYPDFILPDDTGVLGATYSPGGKVLVVALGDSIEFWDTNTGRLRDRLTTPTELQVLVYPENAVAPMIALNAVGDTIFSVIPGGIAIISLPGPLDQMTPKLWPEYRPMHDTNSSRRGTMAMRMRKMPINTQSIKSRLKH